MKTTISLLALVASLGLATAAIAQEAPAGGPDAKGNAPVKNTHTVNDGSAKAGANSFTQNEARKHIINSGFTSVSPLVKGKDGVWRGTAMKGGANMSVAMDFKGNVTEGGATEGSATMAKPMPMSTTKSATTTDATGSSPAATSPPMPIVHHHHRWRHHHGRHHMMTKCATPGPNGVACSGVDRNRDGIADKDEHAQH